LLLVSLDLPLITTNSTMDPASQALAQRLPDGVRDKSAARSEYGNVPVSTLIHRRLGRRSRAEQAQRQQYLTREEEKALVKFLLLMSSLGQPVRVKYLRSLAFSIARQRSTNESVKRPGKNWPRAFEKRHPELQARRVRSIDWKRHNSNIHEKIVEWFDVIGQVLQDPSVLPENVYNLDETGVMLSMLGSAKVLVGRNEKQGSRGGSVKRTMVTAIECISANGKALLPLIIWPASTHRSNWTTHPTLGWHYGFSENGYNDSKISLEWLKRVFDPQARETAGRRPRVLICDGFGTHETLEILEFCLANNIILCRLPSHTSHKLQPCDVGPFAPLKTAYREQVERLNRGGVDMVGKEHFTYLYSPARDRALTSRNIRAGWSAAGLFPFNPEQVLRDVPKPVTEVGSIDPEAEATSVDLLSEVPRTPITPVIIEALTSMYDLIVRDTYALDATNKDRLQKRIQKLACAAKVSFATQALLKDRNQFLLEINREAKVRRSTKSLVLGKAKVMSFEDLKKARAKRAEKEQASVSKPNRGRGGRGCKRKSDAEGRSTALSLPEPAHAAVSAWTAPVAKMY
jgi:hypothetical protein